MSKSGDSLTPESLKLLLTIAKTGSFAAAARELGVVPSALTYRVRLLEDALDVLLFDRSSRQAKATPAGLELLKEAQRLLTEVDALANRLKRIATGWESQFTIAVDGAVNHHPVFDLCERFFELKAPTRLRLKTEVMAGTLEALVDGQADLAIGVGETGNHAHLQSRPIGVMRFPFVVARQHPLAQAPEPLSDEVLQASRAVAVADSVKHGPGLTFGLLKGQDVFTVATLHDKLLAQLRGFGVGFLPHHLVQAYLLNGQLVEKIISRERLPVPLHYAWRSPKPGSAASDGLALQWWLAQLASPNTLQALVS